MTRPHLSRPTRYPEIPPNTPEGRLEPTRTPSPALGEGGHPAKPLASAFPRRDMFLVIGTLIIWTAGAIIVGIAISRIENK